MSFVFLESEKVPLLNGLIGLVHDRDRCAGSAYFQIQSADWYIESPFVHLRYYLEEWFADFLTWMQFFYVPELAYCHRDELADRKEDWGALQKLQSEVGISEAKEKSFSRLVGAFQGEADRSIEDMKKW
jgi:hypothetical protein